MLRRWGFVSVLLGSLLVLASAAGASQPPNVTGAWSPGGGAPAWQLTASGAGLTHLHAEWHGPPGHSKLFGTFDGSLNAAGTAYSGGMAVTEGAVHAAGSMTFTLDSPTKITVTYSQANGVAGTIVLAGHVASSTPATESVTSTSFGTPVTEAAPANTGLGAVSPTLPAGTKQVTLDGDLTDAEIDKLLGSIDLKKLLDAYNERRYRENVAVFCLIFAPSGTLPRDLWGGTSAARGKEPCITALGKLHHASLRTPAGLTSGCAVAIAPVWTGKTPPTRQRLKQLATLGRARLAASCTTSGSHFSLHLAARGVATLNTLLGSRARAGFERTSGGNDGPNPQLSVTWRH
jgi:hypothetical protein